MTDERVEEIQLPPAFLKFSAQLKSDRKVLLRDKAYGQNPDQLRAFIAQFLYPRLLEQTHLFGGALLDTYGLAVSSENQIQRMRAVYGKALKKLGADVENEEGELPGLSPEILDEFQQAFYALGSLLQKKLPEDKEMERAYNKCAEILGDMVADLLGEEDDDEDEGDDDEEDDEEGGDEPEPDAPKEETVDQARADVKPAEEDGVDV